MRAAVVLLAYAACAVAFTFPLAFHALDSLPDHDIDVRVAVWTQWWFGKAAFGPETLGHTSYLFHPEGLDLTAHSEAPLTSAIAVLLRPLVGEIGAFNLSMLLLFPIGGWGMYLLARDLTGRPGPSFVAGLVWAFAPYHLTQALAHPSLAAVQGLPFQTFFLRRVTAGRGAGSAALAGIAIASSFASGLQIGILAVLAAAAQVLATLVTSARSRTRPVRTGFVLAAVVAAALTLPVVAPQIAGWRGRAESDRLLVNERLTGQTDALAWLTPPRYHPLLGPAVAPVYERFAKNRQWMPYLGLVPLALALFAAVRIRGARPWLAAAGAIAVCALGARLRVAGAVLEALPLPYALVDGIPPFSLLRSADRFNLLLPLPLAALVALALAQLRFRHAATTAAALIAFEFLCVPLPLVAAYPESEALARLADPGERGAILDLPLGRQPSKHWMLLQTRHGRPIAEGMAARTPPEAYRFLSSVPLVVWFARDDAAEPAEPAADFRRLAEVGIARIVVHTEHASAADLARFSRFLGDQPDFEDAHLRVYDTARLARSAPLTPPARPG